MTYELSCSGRRLILRFVLPKAEPQGWQLEARLEQHLPPTVVSGATRELALRALMDTWAADSSLSAPDWEGVATALLAVRGLSR